jgi:hypothetical protein
MDKLQLAQEQAHQRVKKEFVGTLFCNTESDLYENPTDTIQNYKPEVMDRWQQWVDYYYEILTNID